MVSIIVAQLGLEICPLAHPLFAFKIPNTISLYVLLTNTVHPFVVLLEKGEERCGSTLAGDEIVQVEILQLLVGTTLQPKSEVDNVER